MIEAQVSRLLLPIKTRSERRTLAFTHPLSCDVEREEDGEEGGEEGKCTHPSLSDSESTSTSEMELSSVSSNCSSNTLLV